MSVPVRVAALLLISSCPAAAQTAAPGPTLVVAITLDQARGDYLDRFRSDLTGGLARLAREGAVFIHAYQDHGVTETAPGHATILSGRYAASNGIVTNGEGVPDSSAPLVDGPGAGASPWRFQGTELFDWMHARWPASRALSVAFKDRSAILPVGRARQTVYWWTGGRFTTSRWYADSLPDWVRAFNGRAAAAVRGLAWTPLLPRARYPEPDSEPYENDGHDAFPHTLSADAHAAAEGVQETPWGDSLALAFALEGLDRLGLGRGLQPDLLHIGLSATDRIGHRYGPNSVELHDQIVRVDRWLGVFLDSLTRLHRGRLLVVLTADHGVTPFPEWSQRHGQPDAAYLGPQVDSVVARTRAALEGQAGVGRWIPWREAGLIALDRAGLAARHVDVDSVVDAMAAELRRLPGIVRVDTRRTLAEPTDTVRNVAVRRWRRMLAPGSLGEVFITPRGGDLLAGRGSTTHGTPNELDTRVTLVLWGAGVRAGRYARRVGTVDIAPTLARLLDIEPAERLDGRVLREAIH
jgi:predicted AlkP superfamily pyrophosphatase or phosphodiesterase